MPATSEGPPPASPRRAPARRGLVVLVVAVVLVLAAVAGVSVWAVLRSKEAPVSPTVAPFTRYETAWSSALGKAGTEAEFPDAPVDVTALRVTGRRPFEATLSAEEVTALMNVYRYEGDSQQFVFDDAQIAFPEDGVMRIDTTIVVDNTRYSARAVMPLTYDPKGVHSPGITSLSVEGFGVGGERKRQASDAVLAYLNGYLHAVPGLTLDAARIEQGQVRVSGTAPVRIENP